ncbi:MAG: enolase C-terminal domain-like protein [Phycisphaerales bacterium]
MRIESARTFAIDAPLVHSYVLSFTTLTSFTMRIVEVMLDSGRAGLGEVVALPGYGLETDADVADALERACGSILGLAVEDAIERLDAEYEARPFARSAAINAIEEARDGPLDRAIQWPQAGVLAAEDPAACVRRAAELAEGGFGTIKVKVGRDVRTEVACARALLAENPGVGYRFDANQAYIESDAVRFLEALGDAGAVELIEQPLAINAWDAFARLAQHSGVPLMLDESILTESDIDRAADVGASLIKLKLCKAPGRAGLIDQATRARGLGLGVVLGNGVSGPIGNLAEARAWAHDPGLWAGAGEANGFAKLAEPVLHGGPTLEQGSLRFAGGPIALCERPAAGGHHG